MKKQLLSAVLGVFVATSAYAQESELNMDINTKENGLAEAYFAGGCFWCIESDFEKLDGVKHVESGYANANKPNPTYKQVSSKAVKAVEAVRVTYDPKTVSYPDLVKYFYTHIDPLDKHGQFCDKGYPYRSMIYHVTDTELLIAENVTMAAEEALGQDVATEIQLLENFTEAEDYHQDYYKKNPLRYKYYRFSCGRDARVKELWEGKSL
jgi:peptide-methionine (S)-S-oxide reductase